MNSGENFSARAISRPLIQHQGTDREGTDGDEGPSGKRPPDVRALLQDPCINSDSTSKAIDIVHRVVSLVNTRWRFIFLAMIATVSFGWYYCNNIILAISAMIYQLLWKEK
jgi:hypothetical protein